MVRMVEFEGRSAGTGPEEGSEAAFENQKLNEGERVCDREGVDTRAYLAIINKVLWSRHVSPFGRTYLE